MIPQVNVADAEEHMAQTPDRTASNGERRSPARLGRAALVLALLSISASAEAQPSDQQAWIEDACPRNLMVPDL